MTTSATPLVLVRGPPVIPADLSPLALVDGKLPVRGQKELNVLQVAK